MNYIESNEDRKLKDWFKKDLTCATLHKIQLNGRLRSLKDVTINFNFPVTVFSGKNGCGKTTVLALAACAYHNTEKGFKFKGRNRNHYTFSDFFIQTNEEVKPDGISVRYTFLHDNWRNSKPGLASQVLTKKKGGKWSKYDKRIKKNVIYLGIDRVVPQTERRVFKTYIRKFADGAANAWYDDVERIVGRILGKDYSKFKIKKAGKYDLQLVRENQITYSGFNMGAGEKALFELFSLIHECSVHGDPSLIIIDEIELGLHEIAQKRLMETLKLLAQKLRIQIICTTHSQAILESVPFSARYYLERDGNSVLLTEGISGSYAAGRLSDSNSNELDILVEDTVALTLLNAQFNLDIRKRIGIMPIGSYTAVAKQLSAAYRHPKLKSKTIAIVDGDQSGRKQQLVNLMINELELSVDIEKTKFKEWVKDRLFFTPGTSNPEKWIITECIQLIDVNIAKVYGISSSSLKAEMRLSLKEEVHHEFYYLSRQLSVSEDRLIEDFSRLLFESNNTELNTLVDQVEGHLQ